MDGEAGDGVAGNGVAGDGVAGDRVAGDGVLRDGVLWDGVAREAVAPRGVRMRVGLGAGVVLVLVAAAIAVLISAASAHPAAASAAGAGGYSSGSSGSSDDQSASSDSGSGAGASSAVGSGSGSASTTAFVQVVGQVRKPGLYELPAGDRIVDAIAAAGGFTSKADQASLNLAQVIADGQQIVVAARGANPGGLVSADGSGSGSGSAGGTAIVDINTADATALETLDGIGPALAQRILDYRTAHGGFRSINDLQNVTGIGPKKFAAIKASVSV